jgi:hypothetical protein
MLKYTVYIVVTREFQRAKGTMQSAGFKELENVGVV